MSLSKFKWTWVQFSCFSESIVPFNPPGPWLCLIILLAFRLAASPLQSWWGSGFCYPEQLSPTVFLLCEILSELPFLENRTRFCLFLNISRSLSLGLLSQYSPLEILPSKDQYLPLSMFEETHLRMACFWIHVSGQLIGAMVVGTRNIKH